MVGSKRSRWESRPLSLVGNGAGAGTHPIDREGSVFPWGTGRFLVKKGVHIASCVRELEGSVSLKDSFFLKPKFARDLHGRNAVYLYINLTSN